MQVHNVLSATAGGALHKQGAGGTFASATIHVEALRQAWKPGQDSALAERYVVNEQLGTIYFENAQDAPAILDTLIQDLSRLRTRLQLELAELAKPKPTEGDATDGTPIPF